MPMKKVEHRPSMLSIAINTVMATDALTMDTPSAGDWVRLAIIIGYATMTSFTATYSLSRGWVRHGQTGLMGYAYDFAHSAFYGIGWPFYITHIVRDLRALYGAQSRPK